MISSAPMVSGIEKLALWDKLCTSDIIYFTDSSKSFALDDINAIMILVIINVCIVNTSQILFFIMFSCKNGMLIFYP